MSESKKFVLLCIYCLHITIVVSLLCYEICIQYLYFPRNYCDFCYVVIVLLESNVIQIWMQLSNAEKTIFGRLVQQFYRFDIKDVNQQVTNKYYISNDSGREKEVVDNNDEHRLWAIFSSNGTLKSRKRIMSHLFLTNFDYCIHTSSSRNKHVSYKRRRVLCHISLNLH